MNFKPMLAGRPEVTDLRFPCLASPKIDGVRALVVNGVLLSRSLKPIRNKYCQQLFANLPEGTDGELIVGSPTATDVYRKTSSGVNSEDGHPDVHFFVFDNFQVPGGFQQRFREVEKLSDKIRVQVVPHTLVESAEDLIAYEETVVGEHGFEGVMLRKIDGVYKHGRSTEKEALLLKVKRYLDADAKIVGAVAWQHNGNVATTNALGRTERSSHKANMIDKPILGKLVVTGLEAPFEGVEFEVGTGFDGADDVNGERGKLWKEFLSGKLVGKIIKFKYFPVGVKDKPRHPVFLGFRDASDRSAT